MSFLPNALLLLLAISVCILSSFCVAEPWIEVHASCMPPGPGNEHLKPPPPCIEPIDLPVGLQADVTGILRFKRDAPSVEEPYGSTKIRLHLENMKEAHVATVWMSYLFPWQRFQTLPCPGCEVFFGDTFAAISAPLAHTKAAWTSGMDSENEPNYIRVKSNGKADFEVDLDFDILSTNTSTLRNVYDPVTQPGQAECCPNRAPWVPGDPPNPGPPQPIGAELIRRIDADTGFQEFEADQKTPKLWRSPRPVQYLTVIHHVDNITHGIFSANPIFPQPNQSIQNGGAYVLVLFRLDD